MKSELELIESTKKLPSSDLFRRILEIAKKNEVVQAEVENNKKKIDIYLDWWMGAHDDPAKERAVLRLLKQCFVVTPDNIAESTLNNKVEDLSRNLNSYSDKQEAINIIQGDQWGSLETWIDYFKEHKNTYPAWFQYLVFHSLRSMGPYNPESKRIKRRERKTTALFPQLYPEIIEKVYDLLSKQFDLRLGKKRVGPYVAGYLFEENYLTANSEKCKADDTKLLKSLVTNLSFKGLYEFFVASMPRAIDDCLETVTGKWQIFSKGDAEAMRMRVTGMSLASCLRGKMTAERYLKEGLVHIYFSHDKEGYATIPRLFIAINNRGRITEIRGIEGGATQDVDKYVLLELEKKLRELGKLADYQSEIGYLKVVERIEEALVAQKEVAKEDLVQFYLGPQESFRLTRGEPENPRVEKIRSQICLSEIFDTEMFMIAEKKGLLNFYLKNLVPLMKSLRGPGPVGVLCSEGLRYLYKERDYFLDLDQSPFVLGLRKRLQKEQAMFA